jgi:hypothetical protein
MVYLKKTSGEKCFLAGLNSETGELVTNNRSKYQKTDLVFKIIDWLCKVLWAGASLPEGYTANVIEYSYYLPNLNRHMTMTGREFARGLYS